MLVIFPFMNDSVADVGTQSGPIQSVAPAIVFTPAKYFLPAGAHKTGLCSFVIFRRIYGAQNIKLIQASC